MISGIVPFVTLSKLAPGQIRWDMTTAVPFSSLPSRQSRDQAEGRMVETLDAAFRDAGRSSVTFRNLRRGNMSAMIRLWGSRGFPRATTLGVLKELILLRQFI